MSHPLDRPVWASLTTRQKPLSQGDDRARRFSAEYGSFAAAADVSPECLAALADLPRDAAGLFLVEAEERPVPPGMAVGFQAQCCQFLADDVAAHEPDFEVLTLGDADAPEMLELALMTRPGPFSTATHRLGRFIGVREGGRLVAMAGERMQPDGFCEVSGVCTHPDHRGRGYAKILSSIVGRRILARGEIPFLHAYETNAGAIRLYEDLGFRLRATLTVTILQPA
ncbi:GNAT family N-acetyltransferase [Phenylobacterium montanum]|uniref:GNAT family N-acetyltransferase n=1 Tax=Phenylobacterium montanum TaxID=2823693 RepID=A0A975IXP3_9CAUL|nr:GNAT family N-acetyltransferase [Caulobacter sp. S6]QUD89626.1 GNAT family N-acetyltransferase [Caulobacter sp. S6]